MTFYKGELLGFQYEIEQVDDAAFRTWLKAKMTKYVLNDSNTNQVLKELLGLDIIKDRLDTLEEGTTTLEERITISEDRITALEGRVTASEDRITVLENI